LAAWEAAELGGRSLVFVSRDDSGAAPV
jgi:hypothetical protein